MIPNWPAFRASLNEVAAYTHSINQSKGFCTDSDKVNDLEQFMLVVAEIAEATEAWRKDLKDDKLPHRSGVEVELADAVIRIFNYCYLRGLDLAGAIEEKAVYNATRSYKHGGKKV